MRVVSACAATFGGKKRETKGRQITFLLSSSNIIFLGKELTNKDSGSFHERSVSALQINVDTEQISSGR